jgi:hypothetical protein
VSLSALPTRSVSYFSYPPVLAPLKTHLRTPERGGGFHRGMGGTRHRALSAIRGASRHLLVDPGRSGFSPFAVYRRFTPNPSKSRTTWKLFLSRGCAYSQFAVREEHVPIRLWLVLILTAAPKGRRELWRCTVAHSRTYFSSARPGYATPQDAKGKESSKCL